MISVEEAQKTILDATRTMPVVQTDIRSALGHVLAHDLTSDIDIAPFDNSAMDGFAFKSADVASATEDNPIALDIIAHIGAGHLFPGEVLSGQAVRIMTGAPVPTGCDCVEKIEHVTFSQEGTVGDHVYIAKPVKIENNIRKAGEEVKKGDLVMRAGEVITPAGTGLLASTGNTTVPVYRMPKVGIISLGSELVDATEVPEPGKIRNSNSHALAANALAAGCEVVTYPTVLDDEEAITDVLKQAIRECDFVLSSGGASAGDFDYITEIADRLGQVHFKYVNMRPGKSQTFAVIDETPFIGLAGNPAAAAIGFEILARPALLKMQGKTSLMHPVQKASLGMTFNKKKDARRNYLRGVIFRDETGEHLVARPADNQSSALLGTLHHSNCLIVMPEGQYCLEEGTPVDCLRIDIAEGTVI